MDKYASLTPKIIDILKHKATEPAFSGKYNQVTKNGSYLCRGCGAVLFRADSQFSSSCGWPSFDEEIVGAVTQQADVDGQRTEITCANCDGHLGHVFTGEWLTEKNQRHCVNSSAIEFIADQTINQTEEAMVAGGCFWGVQHSLKQLPGILLTEVGYTGGTVEQPSYQQVCSGNTGHVEAVRVIFDPEKLSYEVLLKHFMGIHNPTQKSGQGVDKGSQYLSRIFYFDQQQQNTAENMVIEYNKLGFQIATKIKPVSIFWPAEEYHQDYYQKNKK